MNEQNAFRNLHLHLVPSYVFVFLFNVQNSVEHSRSIPSYFPEGIGIQEAGLVST